MGDSRDRSPRADPFEEIERALRDSPEGRGSDRTRSLETALALATKEASRGGPNALRARTYEAEILRLLGRLSEAATAYAAVLADPSLEAEALHDGLRDLLDGLGGLEQAAQLAVRARESFPGRAWQWDALESEARRRIELAATAPLAPPDLERLRLAVAARLVKAPCRHDDDRRPVTAAVAAEQGQDPARVLSWLSALGACCCDCQVARVRGPREPRETAP